MATILSADLTVAGNLTISSSDFDANGFNVTVGGNLVFSSGGTLDSGEGTWTIGGNVTFSAGTVNEETSTWLISGTIINYTGTTYSGGSGSITLTPASGSAINFNDNSIGDLTVAPSGGTMVFADGWSAADYLHNSGTVDYGGETFSTSGIFHISKPASVSGLAGVTITSAGQFVVNSQSLAPGSTWTVNANGTNPRIGHSTIGNLDASGGSETIIAFNSVDSGSNTNVTFQTAEGSDGIVMGGEADVAVTLPIEGSGGIVLSNEFNPTIVDLLLKPALTVTWGIEADIVIDAFFSWDTGSTDLKWYRIEGKCLDRNCQNAGFDPGETDCNTKSLLYVAAENLADLCIKLKEGFLNAPFKGQISSIKRHSRPVFSSSDLLESEDECNELIDEDFSSVIECVEFTIDENLEDTFGAITLLNDVFLEYEATGNTVSGSGIQLRGSADAERVIPVTVGLGGIVMSGAADVATIIGGVVTFSYESDGGIITGGSSDAIQNAYVAAGSGGIVMGGDAVATANPRIYEVEGGILMGGSSNVARIHVPAFPIIFTGGSADAAIVAYSYVSTGGITMGGSSDVTVSSIVYEASGGIVMGGDAVETANPWIYDSQVEGGIMMAGEAGIGLAYEAIGGITMGGSADAKPTIFVVPEDGIMIDGEATIIAAIYKYAEEIEGGIVIGGEAIVESSNLDLQDEDGANAGGVVDELLELTPLFAFVGGAELTIEEGTAETECGCDPLPLALILSHNLQEANFLKSFLERNAFTLPESFNILFRDDGDSWRQNFHFSGLADDGVSIERWNLLFEWQCTNIIGGEDLGTFRWKFCLLIRRENLGTGDDFDTRLIFSIPSVAACPPTGSVQSLDEPKNLNVTFLADTQTKFVITNNDILSDPTIFTDGIGLFASPFWFDNPDLIITLSQVEAVSPQETFDIQPIFPAEPLLLTP